MLRLMADEVVFMVPGRDPFGKREFAAAAENMKGSRLKDQAIFRNLRSTGLGMDAQSP